MHSVRRIETESERASVYAFRYRIYVQELAMTSEADHERKWLRDEFDDYATSFAVFDGQQVLGSLRMLFLDDLPDISELVEKFALTPAIDALGTTAIATTSRFILDARLRHGKVIFRLMRAAFAAARERGVRLNYGDCSPHLLPFYEHLGYRRYTKGYNDTLYGYKIPILMLVGDQLQFQTMRSPLARLAAQGEHDAQARDWFARTYPAYVAVTSAAHIEEGAFLDLLAERVASDPLHKVSLLRGLTREQADSFLAQATLIELQENDYIIREGAIDETLYVLLRGLAEVRLAGKQGPPLAVIGEGDTFGEIGFLTAVPRTADVVAVKPSQVLVLSSEFLSRFISTQAEIGAQVLLNLSRELASRLAVSGRH
ncbi:MAG: cyclic nucleotide-binding domain-containing protein [Gammaproteobacteria bacterium]|nr:cyclic nucleotide-binding domain-containing protein [Gammaproteobacteria bacterium]